MTGRRASDMKRVGMQSEPGQCPVTNWFIAEAFGSKKPVPSVDDVLRTIVWTTFV